MARDEARFTLKRDCICDQAATGGELRPASVEQVIVADASSDEDRIRRAQVCKGGGCSPLDDLQVWHTEPRGILSDSTCPILSCFEGNAGARWMNTHPLDTDRSGAGSDIPEGLV